jgi:hypothetical protein
MNIMKKLLLLPFILSYRPGLAQNKRIDSLKQVLSASKEDTNKVWVLDELSEAYTFSFAD